MFVSIVIKHIVIVAIGFKYMKELTLEKKTIYVSNVANPWVIQVPLHMWKDS